MNGMQHKAAALFVHIANESVLRWWFRDKLASLVVDDSLIVAMASNDDEQARWTIYISGTGLSPCLIRPANLRPSACRCMARLSGVTLRCYRRL